MTSTLDEAAVAELRAGFSGAVLQPSDPGFEEARSLFNAMIELRPAVIAQCQSTEDVAAAIRFGREHDMEISVRGGGHSVAGSALTDGGVEIDLRRMHQVHVDPDARTVTVGGGATMSHLDRATQPYGLATTGGRVSSTGVGGFTLGGGDGWLGRFMGLACDNLASAELVTADGSMITASAHEHPDLFWALHGGGGNFGVATALTLRLRSLEEVTAAMLLFPPDGGEEIVSAYRDFMLQAPAEVGGGLIYLTGPPEPFVPSSLVGRLALLVFLVYAGPQEAARDLFAPMLHLGHTGEMIRQLPYADMQCMLDDPPGLRNYWSAEYLGSLPDDAVSAFCATADSMLVPSATQQVLFPQGGAVARGPADYPVPWRSKPWVVHPFGLWDDRADDDRSVHWVREVRDAVAAWSSGDVYLNFIGDEGRKRVMAGFGEGHYPRLVEVKRRYDPDNVFHRNHNIDPRLS